MSKFRKLSDKLRCADLKLQPDKCNVRKKVAYLGHVISTTEIKSDPRKIRAVEDFPRPKPTKNVKQFLGLASYYRVFIANISSICELLTNLLKKGVLFKWKDM